MSEVERLLQNAFVPVEPPGALTERLERRLTELTDPLCPLKRRSGLPAVRLLLPPGHPRQ